MDHFLELTTPQPFHECNTKCFIYTRGYSEILERPSIQIEKAGILPAFKNSHRRKSYSSIPKKLERRNPNRFLNTEYE